MSYRNPTYYGIVEDMGAFSKAFTSSFGQIKQAVDAERAAQAEQARQDDAMMAKGYEFVLNQADDLEGETYKTFIEYGNNLIKDGNFARLSASDQQLLLGKIAGVANTSNSVEEIQANLASYEKLIPANLNSAVKGFFKGENKLITEGSGVNTNLYLTYKENGEDKKIAWDKLTSVYNNDLLTQQGDEKYAKDLIKNGVDWVENRLEILAKQNRGSVNTEEQIDNLLKEWVISNKKDIKNQKMDFLWNNGMDDSEKVFETENGEKTDMSGYEYNLYKMRTNPNIATKNGMIEGETLVNVAERGRDMLIEDHVRNKIKNLVDTSYYIPPQESGDDDSGPLQSTVEGKGKWIYNPPSSVEELKRIYGGDNKKYQGKTILDIRPASGYNVNGKFPVEIILGNAGEQVSNKSVPVEIDLSNTDVMQQLLDDNVKSNDPVYGSIQDLIYLPD